MSNMNSRKRKEVYAYLVQRDGEYCKGCGVYPPERRLVVDHKDNNNSNNNSNNHQLLCYTCNYLKNPRGPLDMREGEGKDESELEKSSRLVPLVKEFFNKVVDERGEILRKELLDACTEEFDYSQQAGKRRLDGMCSFRGELEYIKRVDGIYVRRKTNA